MVQGLKVASRSQLLQTGNLYRVLLIIESLAHGFALAAIGPWVLLRFKRRRRQIPNLAFIPSEFNVARTEQFDQHYMRSLYDYAYNSASRGYRWHKEPPNLTSAVR